MFQRFKIKSDYQPYKSLPRKASRRALAIIAVVLIIALIVFLFSSQGSSLIARPYIEGKLQQFAKNMAAQAAQSGDIANFTYDGIEMQGGFFNKKAIIKNPKLEYTARLPFSNAARTDISTSKAIVSAAEFSNSTIHVDFPEPFALERSGYSPILIRFPSGPRYVFQQGDAEDSHIIELPESVVLSPEKTKEADAPLKVTITYKNPEISRSINRKNAGNKTHISFKDVHIQSSEEAREMLVSAVYGNSNEQSMPVGKRSFDADFNIENLVVNSPTEKKGPYQFKVAAKGDYALPDFTKNPEATVNEMRVMIKKLWLKTDEYEVNLAGELQQAPDDQMYFGSGQLDIQGFDVFRNSEFIPSVDAELKDLVIATITENADVNAKEAHITLKREKLGTLYIGSTSFENLIGLIVTHALAKMKDTPANAAVPPANPMQSKAPLPEMPKQPETPTP